MWHIGRQTVGIVTKTATATSEFMEPTEPTESVAWVHNCLFEVQESSRPHTAENERGGTTVTNETAWVFMPVTSDGLIPAFDDDGESIAAIDPVRVTSSLSLRYGKRADTVGSVVTIVDKDYEMRSDAVLEIDINGKPDHVFALCEYQAG